MNTLIINGALKKGGQCEKLKNIFCRELEASEADIFQLDIKPCIDCGCCKTDGNCIIKDDMQEIYHKLERADILIFASPIYYSSLTGVMLNFLSRLQIYYLNITDIKPKKAVLLLTGGGTTKRLDLPEHQLKLALRALNCELVSTIAFMKADSKSVDDDNEIIKQTDKVKNCLFG